MKKHDEFSMKNFQNTYTKIVDMKYSPDPQKLPELLSQVGKQLVWGDQHETDYFEYFCEVKALDMLLDIFGKTKSKQIVTGIIGFFNILLTNITRKQTITYLLSHPCVLSLQNIRFVSLDSQIAEYYINFLKGLSRKVDSHSLHLFYNKRYPTFPLMMQTTRFYNHPENLVRTTCRNILLSCAKIDHPKMKEFVGGFPFITYYIHQCNFLKEYWSIIDGIVDCEGDNRYELNNLDTIIEDQVEILVFFDDFVKINDVIGNRFLDAFTNQCLCPLLQGLYSHTKQNFSLKVILFICALLLKNITNKLFCQFLAFSLFGKYYTGELALKLMRNIEKPLSYSKQWKFKGFWDGYQNNIMDYCSEKYHSSQKIMSDLKAEKFRETVVSPQKYSSRVKSIFGMGTNFYDRQVEKLQNIFGIPIKPNTKSIKTKPTSVLIKQFMANISQPLDLKNCEENPVREVIISYLSSKDDSLVILALNLLKCLMDNKKISQEMMHFCGLNTNPKSCDFSSMITIQKIIKSSLCIMEVQPPSFRICTYEYASQIIHKFVSVYHEENTKMPQQLNEICKSALKISIERINQYIYGNQSWEKSLQLFNRVSFQHHKKKSQTLQVFGLIPKQKNAELSLQDVYHSFPQTMDQLIARDFWLYIIVRDTYCKLNNKDYKYEIANCDEKGKQKAQIFQEGSEYDISDDQIVEGCYKELNGDTFEECDLIFLGGYVVIGKDKRVEYKCTYQQSVMTVDRSDPRKVLFSIGKLMLVIGVETVKKAYEMRKHFLEMKTLMYKYQLTLLVKQTEWLLTQIQ